MRYISRNKKKKKENHFEKEEYKRNAVFFEKYIGMDIINVINYCRGYIADDESENAINLLIQTLESNQEYNQIKTTNFNEILQLSNRHRVYVKEKRLDTSHISDLQIEKNKINKALLDILDEIEKTIKN